MRTYKRALLWFMALFYVFAGVMHFVATAFYEQIMPPYLPWHRPLIYLSGVCEIGLGLAILWPRTRRLAATLLVLLLIAVFPANVHMALHQIIPGGPPPPHSLATAIALWLRLPLQGVLIAWAAWYASASPSGSSRARSR